MLPLPYIFPMLGMVTLTALVLMRLGYLRIGAVQRKEISDGFFVRYEGEGESDAMRSTSRNFSNLFEVPVLFYLLMILLIVTETESALLLNLAWLYVALRYVHSAIQCTYNIVLHRFCSYAASCLVLAVMWVGFVVWLAHLA